jgi:pimeloyl-ACP methyl ester carboxylesterase
MARIQVVVRGEGPPIVLVPSLLGRWEYFQRTIDVLADSFRVVTYSLADGATWQDQDDAERALDNLVEQLEAAIQETGVSRAAICGISFGGMIAVRFAARHPTATSALVLASTPGPFWHPTARHSLYARWPRTLGALFFAEGPSRMWGEISAALPDLRQRAGFLAGQCRAWIRAPLSPSAMAARARLIGHTRLASDCARVVSPTLVLTGEPSLDRVVPVATTTEYVDLIRGARLERLPRTGHLGSVTRPELFRAAVKAFLDGTVDAAA